MDLVAKLGEDVERSHVPSKSAHVDQHLYDRSRHRFGDRAEVKLVVQGNGRRIAPLTDAYGRPGHNVAIEHERGCKGRDAVFLANGFQDGGQVGVGERNRGCRPDRGRHQEKRQQAGSVPTGRRRLGTPSASLGRSPGKLPAKLRRSREQVFVLRS